MKGIGLIVNPIAGMGGRVGLKGTDGVVEAARAAGAEPVAPGRTLAFLQAFRERQGRDARLLVRWITASGAMGADALAASGVPAGEIQVVHEIHGTTTADDTLRTCEGAVSQGAELLLFCGGDGTARDVAQASDGRVPILGIPAGVKMHSGVFAVSPIAAAEILAAFLRGELRAGEGELLDLDEDAYRRGEWAVRLHGTARILVEPHLIQVGKEMTAEVSDESVVAELAEHFEELLDKESDNLFLFGPGSTIHRVATKLSLEKTLLGVDAVLDHRTIETDVNEARILALLHDHPKAKLVVSPIGAQGFFLGRGNLQVSPAVLRRIGTRNVMVIATPGKLVTTPVLRVDTGDPSLDQEFQGKEYLFVLIGYRTTTLHPIQKAQGPEAG